MNRPPDPHGPLSSSLPPSVIKDANKAVRDHEEKVIHPLQTLQHIDPWHYFALADSPALHRWLHIPHTYLYECDSHIARTPNHESTCVWAQYKLTQQTLVGENLSARKFCVIHWIKIISLNKTRSTVCKYLVLKSCYFCNHA